MDEKNEENITDYDWIESLENNFSLEELHRAAKCVEKELKSSHYTYTPASSATGAKVVDFQTAIRNAFSLTETPEQNPACVLEDTWQGSMGIYSKDLEKKIEQKEACILKNTHQRRKRIRFKDLKKYQEQKETSTLEETYPGDMNFHINYVKKNPEQKKTCSPEETCPGSMNLHINYVKKNEAKDAPVPEQSFLGKSKEMPYIMKSYMPKEVKLNKNSHNTTKVQASTHLNNPWNKKGHCHSRYKINEEQNIDEIFKSASTFKPSVNPDYKDFEGCGINIFRKEKDIPKLPFVPDIPLTGQVAKMEQYTPEKAAASRNHAYKMADESGEDWLSDMYF